MKALLFTEIGSYPQVADFDLPDLQEGHVRVSLRAAALNHRDVWITKGQYAGIVTPCVLGSDGAGELDGRRVLINPSLGWITDPKAQPTKGYHILGMPTHGTFAEVVQVPAGQVHEIPAQLSFEAAAALPLAGLTAWRTLMSRCRWQPGDRVLVSGIGGGVALFAAQFALAAGAEVWVTSGSDDKIARARAMGAAGGVNYRVADWSKQLLKDSGGFDVVIDSAAGPGFKELVRVCNPGARIGIYGGTLGNFEGLSPQMIFWKQISIVGSTMGNAVEFAEMLDFVAAHRLVPVVDSVLPLDEGGQAMARMAAGGQFGKLVLKI